jgi:hypothetical protein
MVNAKQTSQPGRLGISCRKYVSEFLYRQGDLVPLHPADRTLLE